MAVVGGGVIGLCVAEALMRRGADVVVIERGECGAGASEGNAGWITPALSEPLPAPGTTAQALRWMLDRSSPFLLRPVARSSYARWLFHFWRSATVARYQAGMVALAALSARTLGDLDRLAAAGVSFEMHRAGLLFLALSESGLVAQADNLMDQRAHGYRGEIEVLDGARARALEPALGEGVAGAVFAADERHVRPESLVAGLVEHLHRNRGSIRERTTARALERRAGDWLVHLGDGEVERADCVVLAAGVETRRLLRPLRVRLPLEGAKGYSLTYPAPVAAPARPLYMVEAKVGLSPFDHGVRLAGTLEVGTEHTRPNARRVAALARAASTYLREWAPNGDGVEWAGLRPLTPDGLPVIGPVPGHDGLHVATGHGMIGVTLAPATAEVLAPAVLDGGSSLELAPFSIARFGSRADVGSSPTTKGVA